jgi:hypothetical protein
MRISARQAFYALSLALVLGAPTIAFSEEVGTSCADCPNYSGAYSIQNSTGATINYQYRWGNRHPWKSMSLPSGRIETHSYPLGENRNAGAPTPYVRFDRIGGDGRTYTPQEYRMGFYAVGYAGYGPTVNRTQPKRYYFEYAADRRHINLFAR